MLSYSCPAESHYGQVGLSCLHGCDNSPHTTEVVSVGTNLTIKGFNHLRGVAIINYSPCLFGDLILAPIIVTLIV